MTAIVEVREMSDEKVVELLDNAREEMFNLRFQLAGARLEDFTRLKKVRREIARLETVLNMRQKAIEAALTQPAVAEATGGKRWQARARFSYEDSAYRVEFLGDDDEELIQTFVNLNAKKPRGRRARSR